MTTFVIDPGHGGTSAVGGSSANNATGPTGLLEKDVTLALALALRTELEARGATVLLTRDTDANLGLAARAHVARDAGADGFLSLHFNAPQQVDATVNGTETWVHTSASAASRAFAARVQAAAVGATGLRDRGVRAGSLGVLKPAHHAPDTAACLLEVSFLTNTQEEARLRRPAYLASLARALAAGLTGVESATSQAAMAYGRAGPLVERATSHPVVAYERAEPLVERAMSHPAVASGRAEPLVERAPSHPAVAYGRAEPLVEGPLPQAAGTSGRIERVVEHRQSFDAWNEVPLVPQLTGMSCWAAAAAMLVGWRDRVAVEPEEVARGAGYWAAYRDGLDPADVPSLAAAWGLTLETPRAVTLADLRRLLEEKGPLWAGEASPGLHSVVLTGMYGDGTPDGTFIRINDPWPEGRGARYRRSFRDLMRNFAAAADMDGIGFQLLHAGGHRGGRSAYRYRYQESSLLRPTSDPDRY